MYSFFMQEENFKTYFAYLKSVKLAEIILFINLGAVVILVALAYAFPGQPGKPVFGVIKGIEHTIFPFIEDFTVLDMIFVPLILTIPSIVALFIVAYFYFKVQKLPCKNCGEEFKQHNKVMFSFSPELKCKNCGVTLNQKQKEKNKEQE